MYVVIDEVLSTLEVAVMINQEILNKLRHMKMHGFAEALEEQDNNHSYRELDFNERLNLLVDREFNKRQHVRLQRIISQAKFQYSQAAVENIIYEDDRRLDRNLILELASCNYVPHARNVIIVGATGAGKSYLAQALGISACRRLIKTRYIHLSDLLDEFRMAREKGIHELHKLRRHFEKYSLLIIDEWLLFSIDRDDTEVLLALIDRRNNIHPTIIVSQFEPAEWLDQIPIAVAAEAITDRLTAKSYKITIHGNQSMRTK